MVVAMILFFVAVALLQPVLCATLNASDLAPKDQLYKFNRDDLCMLLAHESIILKNDTHHLLVLDGGFGKFRHGSNLQVLDMNRYTAAFDLSEIFATSQGPNFIIQHPKSLLSDKSAPVLTQFGLWSDSTQNSIYIHGGNFFNDTPWTQSDYHVAKANIPGNQLWRLDLLTLEWQHVTPEQMASSNRTFAGAACSVPRMNQSFWLGGITNAFTAADTPIDVITPSSQFMVNDHETGIVRYQDAYDNPSEGYWHGSLDHLQVGSGNGFLVSLMSQNAPAGVPQGSNLGQNVSFGDIMLYDLDADAWYKQPVAELKRESIPSLTRFCSAIVHEEGSSSWELWLFGGQNLDASRNESSHAIWVLTMPAFIWTPIPLVHEQQNSKVRSHTCHAVGSQLLIVGGYSQTDDVDPEAPCETEFVKVFDLNGLAWESQYLPGTEYKAPQIIADRRKPSPVVGRFTSPRLEEAFSSKAGLKGGEIAGIVIGVVAAIVVVASLMWWFCFRQRSPHTIEDRNETFDGAASSADEGHVVPGEAAELGA